MIIFILLALMIAAPVLAQSPTLVLPQQQVPLQPPQFGGLTQQQAYNDPCQLTLQNQFYANLAAGGGFPVMDAPTEANTGALVPPTISTEQNTNASAQLAYNKCLAEQEAWLTNQNTATEHGDIDNAADAGAEAQVPGAQ